MVAVSTAAWAFGQLLFTLEGTALSPTNSVRPAARACSSLPRFRSAVAGLIRPDRPGASRVLVVLDVALLAGLVLFVYFYVGASFEPDQRGFDAWRQVATLGTDGGGRGDAGRRWRPVLGGVDADVPLCRRPPGCSGLPATPSLSAAFSSARTAPGCWTSRGRCRLSGWLAAASAWRPVPMAETVETAEPWRDTRRALALAVGTVGMVPTRAPGQPRWRLPMDLALWHTRTRMALDGAHRARRAVRRCGSSWSCAAPRRANARARESSSASTRGSTRPSATAPRPWPSCASHDLQVIDANARCCDLLDLPRDGDCGRAHRRPAHPHAGCRARGRSRT